MSMKLTMKDPYYKTKFFSVKIRAYFDLVRPFTLVAPFFVSMFIMFASLIYSGKFEQNPDWWITIAQASLTLAFLNAASNALNQATDREADAISKPYRPIPRGLVKPDEAQSIAYIFYLFALLRAVTINIYFGIFIFLIMLFTVTYSLPPRMKQYLFINQIWIAAPRGLFGILASWSVFGDPFQKEPLIIGTVAFIFFVGAMTTKDIVDCEADKKTGTKTLINTFGIKKAAFISLPFMCIPFVVIPVLINYGMLNTYLIPLTIFVIPGFLIFYLMKKGTESKDLENVRAWSLMYVTFLFYSISFVLLIVFGESGYLNFF
ncbi:MAG: UbiA family prenyltransferase [Thermoplasmatota archaeon]